MYYSTSLELNKIIKVLDKRENGVTQKRFKKPRVLSSPLKSSVPLNAPFWPISIEKILIYYSLKIHSPPLHIPPAKRSLAVHQLYVGRQTVCMCVY